MKKHVLTVVVERNATLVVVEVGSGRLVGVVGAEVVVHGRLVVLGHLVWVAKLNLTLRSPVRALDYNWHSSRTLTNV